MPTNQQHIIAIGASAGGMEALYTFFDFTPTDNVSYVIIQHLSPDYQSRLAELLGKHSKLTISVARHGMAVESNRVYVIPNKEFLTIRQGILYLSEKKGKSGPHMTIDVFFTSLAADWKDKAIGIILSGTGHDGSAGIEAIHRAGGWVLVQEPATARFEAMPASAIATGVADRVLAPESMPEAITTYVRERPLPGSGTAGTDAKAPPAPDDLAEKAVDTILEMIRSQLPLDFSEYKRATIARRITRRMAQQHLTQPDAYLALLQDNPTELKALAQDFLISVTSFFRDADAFGFLASQVIPALLQQGSDPVKVWVAGCATGEEAYSLAILLQECMDPTTSREVKIFATDLDEQALAVASRGVYDAGIATHVSPERLARFFTREGEGYKVNYSIRKMLIFAQHDLVKNPPYCNIDLISCRNLLIYLTPVLQRKIFAMLHFGLRQGGYLLLGTSENAKILAPQFREVDKKWRVYQKTSASHVVGFENFSLPEVREPLAVPPAGPAFPPGKMTPGFSGGGLLSDVVCEALLGHLDQACLCLDENRRILRGFGEVTRFLLPKMFNDQLNELMPPALSVAFSVAFNRVTESDTTEQITAIPNELVPGEYIRLVLKPFPSAQMGQKLLLVLLGADTQSQPPSPEPFDAGEHTRQHLAILEEELRTTRQKLHAVQEKLESITENMQSFNEELLSANEEMQSGNEELQSVNEELQTINAEHQLKIRELTKLNDDLNNYFRSNVSGQLFVDKQLLLKKFSPSAIQHINLQESDIGRPLFHITTNITFESLVDDIRQVIAGGKPTVTEVQDKTGKWYQVMVMAYIRQADHQPAGAMVTFYEITDLVRTRQHLEASTAELKLAKEQLVLTNKNLSRTNVDLDNFVYTASHDLRSPIHSIQGLLGLLNQSLGGDTDTSTGKLLELMDTSLVKLLGVMNDLTEITRLQKDSEEEGESIPVREILADVMGELSEQVAASDARIHVGIETPDLFYTRKNLRSILYNLLSNAIKYRSPERVPEIQLTFRTTDQDSVLVVSDNGLGLKPGQLRKLFSLYQRFHNHVEGTGVGLYLIKRIVENNGGCIGVTSQEGRGTTFTIHFHQADACPDL
jgi:two-component system CheB/CheR fusion protein